METKTVTLRLPIDIAEYIENRGSMTQGVIDVVETLRRHEKYAELEIKGVFTPEEWKFLADSLNGTMTLDDFRFYPHALVAHNQDADLYEGTAAKWGVNMENLNKKVDGLTASQVEALYRRIEKFWQHPETNLDAWSKY